MIISLIIYQLTSEEDSFQDAVRHLGVPFARIWREFRQLLSPGVDIICNPLYYRIVHELFRSISHKIASYLSQLFARYESVPYSCSSNRNSQEYAKLETIARKFVEFDFDNGCDIELFLDFVGREIDW